MDKSIRATVPVSLGPESTDPPESPLYTHISRATTALVVISAVGIIAWYAPRLRRPGSVQALIPAVVVCTAVAARTFLGFRYGGFFALGMGILVFSPFAGRARTFALAMLMGLAIVQTGLTLDYGRTPYRFTGEGDAESFVVAHTRPNESIVVGPPFVLAASRSGYPEGRVVRRVVPQDFGLPGFDTKAYRDEIRELTTIYIGDPYWYRWVNTIVLNEPEPVPLFEDASIQEFDYFGDRVIVARSRPRPAASETFLPAAVAP